MNRPPAVPLRQYSALLASYLQSHRPRLLLLALLLLSTLAVQLAGPQIVRWFIEAAGAGRPLAILLPAAALFFGLAFLEQLLTIIATYQSETIGWRATNRLREDLALHCLRLDMSFHLAHSPGEMIERIDGDVNDLANFFSQFTLVLLNNFLLLVGVLALLWWEDWRIGLTISVISLVALLLLDWLRRYATPLWQAVRRGQAALYAFLEERLRGREDIAANGLGDYTLNQLYRLSRHLLQRELRARQLQAVSLSLPIFILGIAYSAAYWLSDRQFDQGAMSLGSVYLVFHYLGLLASPLWQIVNEVQSLQQAGGSIGRIQALRARSSRLVDGPGAALPPGALALKVSGLGFSYAPGQQRVLQGIDFHLPAGETLGLLGRTGSGKTSLTRLLFRLYDADQGEIRLGHGPTGGVDIRQARLADLRRHIGLVTQEVQLFQASLRDNLTFFDRGVTDRHIQQLIEELGLGVWLSRLPHGLDTRLGGERSLSAGEAQLLAFMRVLLQDPGLVILDEASSRLDPVTESLIQTATGKMLQGRTGIVIAHRLETLRHMDQVLILQRGRVREYGRRAVLAADPLSRFYQLLQVGRAGETTAEELV